MDTWVDGHGIKRRVTDVFISYAGEDRSRVEAIIRQLQKEGLTLSWDQQIPSGTSYGEFLRNALLHSRLVLVVWSKSSIQSDWVCSEAEFARSRMRLVACKIDNCMPMPPFNTFQAADLSDWHGDPANCNWRVVADLIRYRVTTGNAMTPMGYT
jgi:hypothetical protein